MTAFEAWFQREFSDATDGGKFLAHATQDAEASSIYWEYLERTGDTSYTLETFVKAARIILEAK
jgi:hypothetical protein